MTRINEASLKWQEDVLQAQYSPQPETNTARVYVTGVGWCWMCDGEIIGIM